MSKRQTKPLILKFRVAKKNIGSRLKLNTTRGRRRRTGAFGSFKLFVRKWL